MPPPAKVERPKGERNFNMTMKKKNDDFIENHSLLKSVVLTKCIFTTLKTGLVSSGRSTFPSRAQKSAELPKLVTMPCQSKSWLRIGFVEIFGWSDQSEPLPWTNEGRALCPCPSLVETMQKLSLRRRILVREERASRWRARRVDDETERGVSDATVVCQTCNANTVFSNWRRC